MKHTARPIPLDNAVEAHDSRLIKQGALTMFRLLRAGMEQAMELPGIVQQAATDIREAWEESSRPNA